MKIRPFAITAALAAMIVTPALAQMPQPKSMQPVRPPITSPSSTAPASSALVDINTASSADLDALPGVGKSRATSIIKNRPYKAKDELLDRHILPANIYKGIKDKIIAHQVKSPS